jgi:hypothetical protein
MSDEYENPQLSPEQQAVLQQHAKNVNDLVEYGRKAQGTAAFDDAAQTLVDTLGNDKAQLFVADAMQFNSPDQVIMHLANNPARLEKLGRLPPAQRAVEVARIEAEYSSHGHATTEATPAWKQTHKGGGRVSDADWKSNYGANLTDKQWHAEWDRRHAGEGRK